MSDNEISEKINELRKNENIVILAHNYQRGEIQEIADYTGDSLELSRYSSEVDAENIFFCGVTFMAETAKLISPGKKVYIPRIDSICPMAEMISSQDIIDFKKKNPGWTIVCYVNSTADTKSVSDYCVTSSNAVDVIRKIPNDKIFFCPDKNLGTFCKNAIPEKEFILWQGYCCVHEDITYDSLLSTKQKYNNAEVIVHPECRDEVVKASDLAMSTSKMIKYVRESSCNEFIIGTEEGVFYKMRKENPQKKFHSIERDRICAKMKYITLEDLYNSIVYKKHEVFVDAETGIRAKRCIDSMFEITK